MKQQQFCRSHLIRDVQYAIAQGDAVLGPGLKGLLKRACAIGRRRENLADGALKAYDADLDRRLDRLSSLTPTDKAGRKLQKTKNSDDLARMDCCYGCPIVTSPRERETDSLAKHLILWRTRRDSNPWPLPSEGSALSS